ncbi:MAG: hypothetical protein IJA86_06725 [Clostridia bacterium]|nr:hypothetical protein [Clostridia bacterium]
MHWKDLKTFAIAVLFIVNTAFAVFIFNHWYTDTYYRNTLIDSSLSVFEAGGLHVDRSFLEKKKEKPPVYMGTAEFDRFSEIAERLNDKSYLLKKEKNGIYLIGEQDTFFFGYDFSFAYGTGAFSGKTSSLLLEEGWLLLNEDGQKESSERIAEKFLQKLLPADKKFEYAVICLAVYGSGEERIAVFSQTIDDIPTEHKLYCLISDGKVIGADGKISVIAPSERKKAENTGLCNILFEEKAYIDSLEESERKPSYTVENISYSYGTYFDENVFYFIPLCKITYEDGESRIYNFISGEPYEP